LQFAAIVTDADLNKLDYFETRCRLLPHVIPAPRCFADYTCHTSDANRPQPAFALRNDAADRTEAA
jgi:hypothetical protein